MEQNELLEILDQLRRKGEDETTEFKRADEPYNAGKIGPNIVGLANAANIADRKRAWMVFGIQNKTWDITDTPYLEDLEERNQLIEAIQEGTRHIIVIAIHVVNHPDGRVIMMEVPAAPFGVPVEWYGRYYERIGSSLKQLTPERMGLIQYKTLSHDWSAYTVPDTSIQDLDPEAMSEARAQYIAMKQGNISGEQARSWDDEMFVEKLGLSKDGKLTRAALVLLGRPEASRKLGAGNVAIHWKQMSAKMDYERIRPPFLLASSRVFKNVTNHKLRLMPPTGLLPYDIEKYDELAVYEAMHNCIAHQNYATLPIIDVKEYSDRLVFGNVGEFLTGTPEDYALGKITARKYRNPCLAEAMAELNMIDTFSGGIRYLYENQKSRCLPLPDYDFDIPGEVHLTIYGSEIRKSYRHLLMRNPELSMEDTLVLDRIQKERDVPAKDIRRLRHKGLISGKKPDYVISGDPAGATPEEMILELLQDHGGATRQEINEHLWDTVNGGLSVRQKEQKIGNALTKLRRQNLIYNVGSSRKPHWRLVD